MRVPARITFAATLLCLLLGSVARGAGTKAEAQKHFKAGEIHFRLGRFPEALQEYSKAYEIMPLPGFLFNIGQCHRQLKDYKQAIFFMEGYLRAKPNAKNRAMVMKLIEECKANLEQQQEAQLEEENQKEELARQQEEARLKEFDLKKIEAERQLAAQQEREKLAERDALVASPPIRKPPEVAPGSAFYETWWFWTIVGVAVVGAAGGTVYGVTSGEKTVLPKGTLGTLDRRGP